MEFGYPVLIIILVILLLLFGGRSLPNLTREMAEAIRNFQSQFQSNWRRPVMQQQELTNLRPAILFLLGVIAVLLAMSLLVSERVTGRQLIVLAAVLSSWAVVGYFCFGRKKDE